MGSIRALWVSKAVPDTERDDAATRHMCAGVYLDREFRDMVLRKIHNDPRHRVAPSYGFDLVPVVIHAWRARVLEIAVQVCLLSVVVFGYMADPPAVLTAAGLVGLCWLGPFTLRLAAEVTTLRVKTHTARVLRRSKLIGGDQRLKERARLLAASVAGCAFLLGLPLVEADSRGVPLRGVIAGALILLLLAAGSAASSGALRQCALNRLHRTTSMRPATLPRRLAVIDEQQSHTYVVYRRREPKDETTGPFSLSDLLAGAAFFVGAGKLLHRWLPPLVIQLLYTKGEPDKDGAKEPFRADELVEHLRDAVAQLQDSEDPIRLPGLRVRDRIFVHEAQLAHSRDWLITPPDHDQLHGVINDPLGRADHFLEICVSTSGEIVTTVFLRVAVKGRSLTLDFAACAQTRTPPEYHLLDAYAESGKGAVLRSTLRGLHAIPADIVQSWRLLEVPWLFARAIWARKDRTLFPRRGITIGTRVSVRDEKSTPWQDAEFDEPLILGQIKIIELCLIKATEDFLEKEGIDLSSFKKRADTIISANVLNMGGRMDIHNSAVGNQAQVNQGQEPSRTPSEASAEGAVT